MPTTYAIPNGRTVFDATTYSGNSSTQSITNSGAMKPDLVWIKARSSANAHLLTDSVRGVTAELSSNRTDAEQTVSNALTSFNANGFSLGNQSFGAYYGSMNDSGVTYVGWQWQAGQGTTSSNTNGSITSTVSVNATAGFSVVTYTGTGSIATIGHGLGVAPAFIVVKARNAAQGWLVYHQSIGNTGFVYLNDTSAASYSINGWNNTSPTSTVFTSGVNGFTNQNGQTQVAYCWAEIAGFSKFGSYTGNGSTDGPFVYTGFRPRWILFKRSDDISSWELVDGARAPYNVVGGLLQPSSSAAETSSGDYGHLCDFLSNGFKIRSTSSASNSGNVIYAAFAENPFKYANAR